MFRGSFNPTKIIEVSSGDFACPKCNAMVPYKLKEKVQVRRFHLFIKVIGETLETFVECQKCEARFTPEVLRRPVPKDLQAMLDGVKGKLSAGTSLQEAEAMFIEAGFELVQAKRYVAVCAGIALRKCVQCGLTYRAEVHRCHKCGNQLPALGQG
jgi:hypothetical protein